MKLNCLILLSILNIINATEIAKLKEFINDGKYMAITVLLSGKSNVSSARADQVQVPIPTNQNVTLTQIPQTPNIEQIQEPKIEKSSTYVEYEEVYKFVMDKICKASRANPALCDKKVVDKTEFLKDDFMTKLCETIGTIKKGFGNFNEKFNHKFSNFITKWLLIKVQEYSVNGLIKSNEKRFRELFTNVKLLEDYYQIYIDSEYHKNLYSSVHLNYFKTNPSFQLECLRKWDQGLESNLESLLNALYSGKSCSYIADKYFSPKEDGESSSQIISSGFLTNDPLLSSLWYNIDSKSWNECMRNSKSNYEIDKNGKHKASPKNKNGFQLNKSNFIFDFNPSCLQDESDMKLFLKNKNHKILFSSRDNYKDNNFESGIEFLERFKILNWKNVLNIFEITNFFSIYSNQILKHFQLKYLINKIKDREFYPEILNQIQNYEKTLKNKKDHPRMMIKNKFYFKKFLALLDEIGELKQKTVEILFGFEPDNEWNTSKFKEFRTEMRDLDDSLYSSIEDFKFTE